MSKSSNPKRISENLKATQLQLDAEDMSRIRAIDRGLMLFKVRIYYVVHFIILLLWMLLL
jgi:diketogulonate reductase-like aldo/keto reductase